MDLGHSVMGGFVFVFLGFFKLIIPVQSSVFERKENLKNHGT